MNDHVVFVVEFSLKSGQLDRLKSLVQEIIADIRPDEPGTLNYEYFISADAETFLIVERYVDSAAALQHLGNFGVKFADRLSAMAEPKSFKVCGHLSDELSAAVSAAGALLLAPIGGFSR